jgi:hypothetical protein
VQLSHEDASEKVRGHPADLRRLAARGLSRLSPCRHRYRVERLIDERRCNAKVIDWLDEITADCPKKLAHNMNDPCGARCPDLPRGCSKFYVRFTPNSDIDCVFRHIRFGP